MNRSALLYLLSCWLFVYVSLSAAPANESNDRAAQLIQQAGRTESELERYRLLKELEALPELTPALGADLQTLLPLVDNWANGKNKVVADPTRAAENGYLCRFITTSKAQPEGTGALYPPTLSPGSPLQPLWCFYRARLLLWRVIQSGPLLRVPKTRDTYYGEAWRLLKITRQAYPENRIVRMYLGEAIPWPKRVPSLANAPEWANLQREGLEKLADVIHWWIDERQLPDGQFGGGWGDDVEMWRWWIPVLVAFEDPKVNAAQERISSGIFLQPHLRDGFTSRVTDVEHSNEDTTDTILPMMHLKPEDPIWQERALKLAQYMRERWTGHNERGFLQFKSIYFSVERVDTNAARAFDSVYHPTIVQPTLLLWQRTGNLELGKLFGDWLNLWVDATTRAENGKPAGVLPSVIRWPEGTIGRPNEPWWQPFSPGINDALYNWPGATRHMTSTLLLANHMSGDPRYLEPIRSMAAIRLKYMNDSGRSELAPGSEAWCARNMKSFLSDTLAKYRFLTGDTHFDKLLLQDASGYARYRLAGDKPILIRALNQNAEAFRSNWEGYTSEMRWTDRVISFTRNYLDYLPNPPPAPSPEILYCTATGDAGNPLVFPLNRVRWLTLPREIAALVREAGPERFQAQLFHFGKTSRPMGAELYLLKPGDYECSLLTEDGHKSHGRQTFKVEGARTRIAFALPAQQLCTLSVQAK